MRTFFSFKLSTILLLLLCLLQSCANKQSNENSIEPQQKIATIPLDVATDVAKNFYTTYYGQPQNKEIEEQLTLEENNLPFAYLFNFKGGGFLMLSAENAEMPILADGIDEKFPLKGEINRGLGIWLLDTRNRIKAIREGKIEPNEFAIQMWKDLKNHTFRADFKSLNFRDLSNVQLRKDYDEYNSCDVPYQTNQVNPLLQTKWGQGCGFNDFCPATNNSTYCNHSPTGCVATAMAQVVRFNQFPNQFNYANMLNNTGTTQTAQLMAACGQSVLMDYGENSSGAFTPFVVWSLRNWGYSNDISYSDYNGETSYLNINAGRPVILDGCTDETCFLWWCWGSGDCHAWITDGYQRTYHPCYGEIKRFHMNWGWNGILNGFYYNPNPSSYNFQYQRHMLYNIHL